MAAFEAAMASLDISYFAQALTIRDADQVAADNSPPRHRY